MRRITRHRYAGVHKLLGIAALVVPLFAAACAQLPIPITYSPSSAMSATGNVTVASFRYIPAEKGEVAPNQFHNTAMGNIKVDHNIADFYRDAVFKELRFVGVKVDGGSKRVLTGDINDYLIDDLGYSVDWTVDVTYTVADGTTGKPIYSAEKVTKSHTAKFANSFATINEQIKLNVEELLKDPNFIAAIN